MYKMHTVHRMKTLLHKLYFLWHPYKSKKKYCLFRITLLLESPKIHGEDLYSLIFCLPLFMLAIPLFHPPLY